MTTANGADVLIVGAGVLGAATAYEARRLGLGVTVLDKEAQPASGATRRSLGGLTWLTAATDDLRSLCREGLARHRVLSEELGLDTSFRPMPLLALAEDDADFERLRAALEDGRRCGFEGAVVSGDDLHVLEPALTPGVAVGAVRCEQGHVEASTLTAALLEGAIRAGARLSCGTQVSTLMVEGGRCLGVMTDDGPVYAGSVVLAAGAWTRRLLATAGVDLCILHTHAEMLETAPLARSLRHIVVAGGTARASLEQAMASDSKLPLWDGAEPLEVVPPTIEFGAVQFADGRVHLGQRSRAYTGFAPSALPEAESQIREQARRFLPQLAEAPAALDCRPVAISADRLPTVGPVPSIEGLYVVAGMTSPLIFAPAIAAQLAARLAGNEATSLAPFDPGRFSTIGL